VAIAGAVLKCAEQKKAFKKAKKLVSKAPVLTHYDAMKPIKLYCDASPYGLGACLIHIRSGWAKTTSCIRFMDLDRGRLRQVKDWDLAWLRAPSCSNRKRLFI